MRAKNVKLIFFRELRDQLRDRRTLFSVLVLPVLLYPLLGLMIMQVTQFRSQSITKLQIIGTNALPEEPKLLIDGNISEALLSREMTQDQFLVDEIEESGTLAEIEPQIQTSVKEGKYGVVVYFPPGFSERLQHYRQRQKDSETDQDSAPELPEPRIFGNTANEKSQQDLSRLKNILFRWREQLVAKNLEAHNVPEEVTNPFVVGEVDFAEEPQKRALLWSKIFPFIVVIWALTGAFYPAIDLCAGEKERGTLETLLSSPALRTEIVGGKLLAIMSFSMATSLLNLASMGITALLVIQQIQAGASESPLNIGPPPLGSISWLLLALIPMSALFSALSLAVAALARSSKEGQYYLVPLLLINLPLVVLPVLPNFELTLGTSLIPVTGVLLLMKALMEGEYFEAVKFFIPVTAITAFCIWLSVRWAVDQFNNESVLFRESERFDLRLWLSQTIRDRGPTPGFGAAIIAGLILLMLKFFISPIVLTGWMPAIYQLPPTAALATLTLISQIGFILIPLVLIALITCRSAKRTFLLNKTPLTALLMAIILALTIHPLSISFGYWIQKTFPIDPVTLESVAAFGSLIQETPLPIVILLLAVTPALVEEFVFRGYILSGMRHMGHKWTAIIITAFLFGVTHGLLQQSISATVLGVLIGFIAVQTGSIWPGVAYHLVHNSLPMIYTRLSPEFIEKYESSFDLIFDIRFENSEPAMTFDGWIVGCCAILSLMIVRWFAMLPAPLTEEEQRLTALEHQSVPSMPAKKVFEE